MKETDIIIGMGEIGESIYGIIANDTRTFKYDISRGKEALAELELELSERDINIRILHICFPYSKDFVKYVKQYRKKFHPSFTVIHSTVPVGTSRKCKAIHSPVVGVHPHLAESLKTFTKFFGGKNASIVADIFKRYGVHPYVTDKPETTELMKILCTTNYALNIEYTKMIKEECDKYKVPFEIFTVWNDNYNKGYEKLGYPQYHRYSLVPLMKTQGGHCTINNLHLLDNNFTKFLKEICI